MLLVFEPSELGFVAIRLSPFGYSREADTEKELGVQVVYGVGTPVTGKGEEARLARQSLRLQCRSQSLGSS